MIRKLIFMILMGLLLLCPFALAEEAYDHAVLIYMVGADLEEEGSLASGDIQEMLDSSVGKSDVCVLLMMGGAEAWADKPNAVYRLQDGELLELVTLPSGSMGDSGTLRAFLDFSLDYAQAQCTGLILWDHGYGPMEGFGLDLLNEGDHLTLQEMTSTLAGVGKRLDWIGFDACLMGSVETAVQLAPYADYLIASQETEPGDGWNYRFISALQSGTGGAEIGRTVVDDYFSHYEEKYAQYPAMMPLITLSCIDLRSLSDLNAAMDDLFSAMNGDLQGEKYSDIVRARVDARTMGVFTTLTSYDLVDLANCAGELTGLYPHEAQQVMDTLRACTVHSRSNSDNLNGLSVYFPYDNIPLFLGKWGNTGETIGCSEGYQKFLYNYSILWMQERLSEWIDENPLSEEDRYSMILTDRQVADFAAARYFVLEESFSRPGAYRLVYGGNDLTLEGNVLRANFDGKLLYAVNGNYAFPIATLRRDADSSRTYYQTFTDLCPPGEDILTSRQPSVLLLAEDRATGEFYCTGTLADDGSELSTGKQPNLFEPGTLIHDLDEGYYPAYDENGNPLLFTEWLRSGYFYGYETYLDDNFRFEKREPEGLDTSYHLLIEAVSTSGECIGSQLTTLEIGTASEEIPVIPETAVHAEQLPVSLLDAHGLSVSLDRIALDANSSGDETLTLTLTAKNSSSQTWRLNVNDLAVQGIMNSSGESLSKSLNPSEETTLTCRLSTRSLVSRGISSPVTRIELALRLMSENDDSLNTIVSISGSWDFTGEQVYQPSSPGFELSAQRTTKSDLVQMEVLNVALNPSGKVIVQIMAENLSDRYIGVRMDQVCLNDCKVSSGIHHGLLPRARHLFELSLSTGSLLMMDALPLEEIRLQAEIVDRLTSRPLETTPELTLSLTKIPPVPLYSSQGVSISLLAGFSQDLSYYSKGNLEYSLLLENQTRSAVQLAVSGAQINGQEVPVYDLMNIGPGSYCVDQLDIFENGWSELGIRRLESVVVDLEIWSVDKRTRLALIEDVVLYSAP